MIRDIAFVALGGALGSAARYIIGLAMSTKWPTAPWMGTVTVNLLGSFAMGFLFAFARRNGAVPGGLQLMLTVGLLGGFTTFSTFSLDTLRALESGRMSLAAGYVLTSVAGGLVGCFAGFAAGRSVG